VSGKGRAGGSARPSAAAEAAAAAAAAAAADRPPTALDRAGRVLASAKKGWTGSRVVAV
jgi:hypothetical protein